MPKRHYLARATCSRGSLLRLKLSCLAVLLTAGFSTNAFAQILISLPETNVAGLNGFKNEHINRVETIGERLFVGTRHGLWIVNQDATQSFKVESIAENIIKIVDVGDEVLVCSNPSSRFEVKTNFWLINKDGTAVRNIGQVVGNVSSVERTRGGLLLGTNSFNGPGGLWLLKQNSAHVEQVKNIPSVNNMEEIDGRVLIEGADGLWLVSNADTPPYFVGGVNESMSISLRGVIEGDFLVTVNFRVENETQTDIWRISQDGRRKDKLGEISEQIIQIEKLGDQLLVCTHNGLWTIDKDGTTAEFNKDIDKPVSAFTKLDDVLLVSTIEGLWVVNVDGTQARKVEIIPFSFFTYVVDEWIFISDGDRILLMVSKDFKQIYTFPIIRDTYLTIKKAGRYFYILTGNGAFLLDPQVSIKSKLVPNSLWSKITGSVLPPNWLPSERVQAKASYADENGKDPYDETYPREFSFAKAEGKVLYYNKFSTQEDFSYEIGWGKNEVRYWVKDRWGNTFEQEAVYYGIPSQYLVVALPFILSTLFILGCFVLAPKVGFCHSAIMNPWLRKYFSLGSVPLLLSVFPSLRRHSLHRYSTSVKNDKEFTEWKTRFVYPEEEFLPENFGKKLKSERKLLLTGQSGIGKTSFFKNLTACYVSQDRPPHPAKVFPIYISLTNYGGNSLEELVYNQLFSYGRITDAELAPMFLEQGGLLIFLDGVNEVQGVTDRQRLSEFVGRFWTSNYICLSSQQSYPEIDNIPKVELKAFDAEKVCEFIRRRVSDKETAEQVIRRLTDEDYQLYSIPRDLEFAVEILNGGDKSLPKSRTELYQRTFSAIFARWKENGNADAEDTLCAHAYTLIVQRDLAFDTVNNPRFKEVTEDLYKQKFLMKREGSYNFRHDLIRAYLASEFFYMRWKNLFCELDGTPIDSNWLEMLKFSCERIKDSTEIKDMVYAVMGKSVRKDLVRDLFEWLKANHPSKCRVWEKNFYAKYGELDFKRVITASELPNTDR